MTAPTIKKLKGSLIEIESEVSADDFARHVARATKEFVNKTEIKGFRKGHAPEDMVVRSVGDTAILERAAELALQNEWPKILQEKDIEAIGHPEFQILKIARGNPLSWRAKIAVLPEIHLPDYPRIARETREKENGKEIIVEEKEIADALSWLQKSRTEKGGVAPTLNDNFAASLGNFQSLDELKKHIKENIALEKKAKEKERVRLAILSGIAEKTDIDLPDILIRSEQEKMLQELQTMVLRMGLEWNKYLEQVKKTDEEIRSGFTEDAKKRATYGLLLKAIARAEHINASDDEIEKRIERILAGHPKEEQKKVDRARLKDYAYGIIVNEKVFSVLEKNEGEPNRTN